MACSTPPMYWLTGSHRFTASESNATFSDFGLRKRRKYQLESTKVSIVSLSRRASPPHVGHDAFKNASFVRSGDSPVGLNSTWSGSRTGRSDSGTGWMPQRSHVTIGMGAPQYRWREMSQSRDR